MKWQWLYPSKDPSPIDVLHEDGPDGVCRLRERYQHLACATCGKLDEYAAIRSGISKIALRTKKMDLGYSEDDIYWCSPRFKEVLDTHKVGGLEYVPIHSDHFLLCPTNIIEVDTENCGLDFRGQPCTACGRYREVLHSPSINLLPTDDSQVYYPSLGSESTRGRRNDFMFSSPVIALMRDAKLTGIDWTCGKKWEFDDAGLTNL